MTTLPSRISKLIPLYAPDPYYRLHIIKPTSIPRKLLIDTLNAKPYRFNFTNVKVIELIKLRKVEVFTNTITSKFCLSNKYDEIIDKFIKRKLNPFDIITYNQHIHENYIPLQTKPLTVLNSGTSEIIAIDKPSGIPVHGVQKYYYNTIQMMLSSQLNMPISKLFPIHRLDRLTSGVLLWTTSSELVSKFKDKLNWEVEKLYIARIKGRLNAHQCDDDLVYIYPTRKLINQYKNATTKFQEIVYDPVINESIILARLYRGYPHQIRNHLRNIRNPIVDDPLYGEFGKYREIIKSKDEITDGYWNTIIERTNDIEKDRLRHSVKCTHCSSPILEHDRSSDDYSICLHSWRYTFTGTPMGKYAGQEYSFESENIPDWCVSDIKGRIEDIIKK